MSAILSEWKLIRKSFATKLPQLWDLDIFVMQEYDMLIPCKRSLWLGMKETVAAVYVTLANSVSARRAVTCPSARKAPRVLQNH